MKAVDSALPAAGLLGAQILRAATRVIAARPAAKPLHPQGSVVRGTLHRFGNDDATGAAWLDQAGDDQVLVRLSRAIGLPAPAPDIFGLALRVPTDGGQHGDLLFASTGLGPLTRFTLTPTRSNSYVPARALLTLMGKRPSYDDRPAAWNHAMHWSTGALLGALRGVWAVTGIRGTEANAAHTAVRLAFDQTVENATGVGAPPSTWPSLERRVDVAHKAVYSFVTGLVADRWITPRLQSRRGVTSH